MANDSVPTYPGGALTSRPIGTCMETTHDLRNVGFRLCAYHPRLSKIALQPILVKSWGGPRATPGAHARENS